MLDGKTVLITGGTGSFGTTFVQHVLTQCRVKKLIIFSRDELKQYEMRHRFPEEHFPQLRYFIGDVRDRQRLYRAFDGVDVVIHAAALKQVPTCEYNPLEAVNTNVIGTANVVDAALDRRVEKVIALSTDKAANPINLYGATKLCADKLFTAANSYVGTGKTRFSVVRYGNVMGSRGSVIPFFKEQRKTGVLSVTDVRMTRFWITQQQAVQFVLSCLERMGGGEIFIPKLPSMRIIDLARAIAPECDIRHVGIRPGEKLHEVMVPEDDAHTTIEFDDSYVILPSFYTQKVSRYCAKNGGTPCVEGFQYRSDKNTDWLSAEDLRTAIGYDQP
jgi:UDP-N-acetylglucosamine 4,6-dehydratase